MKAITLTQPWATLVAIGAKQVETRSWKTNYRGPLAIHAAKAFPRWARELCLTEPFRTVLRDAGYPIPLMTTDLDIAKMLPTGVVVAKAILQDMVETDYVRMQKHVVFKSPYTIDNRLYISKQENDFGDFTEGRFAWLLNDVQRFRVPRPAKGALGLWEWDGDGGESSDRDETGGAA